MGELYDALSSLNDCLPPSSQGGELFRAIHDLRQNDATANMLQAQGANPDIAARAKAVADELGVPQPVVEADLPSFEQQLQIRKNREITAQNPALQNLAADNPLAVRMALDDFDKLEAVSKLAESLESGNSRALLEDEIGWINTRKMLHAPYPEDEKREAEIQGQLAALPQYPGGWGYLQRATGFGRGLEKSAERATVFGVAGGAAGSAVGGVGAIPGFIGGFMWGMGADFARSSAANTYAALDKAKDNAGQPLSEPAKYLGAATAGAITFFLARAGGEHVTETTQAGIAALVTRTLEDAVERPTITAALGNLAGAIAKSGLSGAAINGMMTVANMAGEQAARFVTPNLNTILTDPAQQEQFKEQLIDAMIEGAELFPLLEIPGAGMRFIGDSLRARHAHIDAQALRDLANGVSESKTRSRSLKTFIDFMRDRTKGTSIENMMVGIDPVMTLYQKAGVYDPLRLDPRHDRLLGWLPDRDQQLREATATKGDIVIPSADFVSRLAGTDAFNELLPDVRVRPDGMTLREALDVPAMLARTREFAEAARKFSENYRQGLAEDEPMRRVYNDLYPQLISAGYDPKTSDAYARIVAAQEATRAEYSEGTFENAWEAYRKSRWVVRGEGEQGAGDVLNQAAALYRSPKTDPVEFVRDVLKNPQAKKSYFDYGPIAEAIATKIRNEIGKEIGGSNVVLPSDIVKHVNTDHPNMTADRWHDLFDVMANAQEVLPGDPRRVSYGGTPIAFISFHNGRGTVVVAEHAVGKKGERLVIKTFFEDSEKAVKSWVEREKLRENQEKGLGASGSPAYPSPAFRSGDVTPDTSSMDENILPGDEEVKPELDQAYYEQRDRLRKMGSRASLVLPSEGYGTGPHIINLFALKDRSSFLHEAVHIWLEELIHDSAFSERAANNLNILKDWWASRADEMHSQFLRAKKDAEAALRANPDDPKAQARVDTYRRAAQYLGQDVESGPKFFGQFAGDLGLDMGDSAVRMALMTPLHELFARHGEAYFMEGRAPSSGLQPVFDAFRMWLKRIYERVAGRGRQMLGLSQVAGTPIEVSPEVREVMDRIIATDEQIEIMRQQQRQGRLFKSAEDAGPQETKSVADGSPETDKVGKEPVEPEQPQRGEKSSEGSPASEGEDVREAETAISESVPKPYRRMAKSLEAAGYPRPPGHEAHHLVAALDKRAEPARAILRKFDIPLRSADNGTWLPRVKGAGKGACHRGLNTNKYHLEVN
ncbi:MAG TPA: AHH domain-containing protein, partial [Syntrophobacteraceae bacterium]|nr:AHH domain-containing protein [Syntrophobacteraceae bacterium]